MVKNIILESAVNSDVHVSKKDALGLEFITVLQSADTKNRNGRIYSRKILEEAINSPYVRERLATKTLYSEIGHPLDTSVQRQMTIDQRNIGCIITELWWEGNLLKGRCETANTAVGRDLRGLIEQGCQIAFSLRAQGNVHRDPISGDIIVESPLQICTWDVVVQPSHAEAYIEKICEETVRALYKTNKNGLTAQVLTESEDMFLNGAMFTGSDEESMKTIDYTKSYNKKIKPISEFYIPEASDTVVSMNETETVIQSANVEKKVLTEDYIVKDIRAKILGLK